MWTLNISIYINIIQPPKPVISQVSQKPTDTKTYPTYAIERTIGITYNNADVDEPKYYYSLDGKEWSEANETTHNIVFKENGYLYAKITDVAGNMASASTYTVTNIDTSKPTCDIVVGTIKTDRIVITTNGSDTESGITKYEFSKDNGATWVSNGTINSYTFTGLTQNTSYQFKVRCTNGSGLTNEDSESAVTKDFEKITITQHSQTPSSGDYAQNRVIRITYNGTNVENPGYYYSLDGSEWTKVTETTKDLTFTANGYVYAKIVDPSENMKQASTYTVANIDTANPTVAASVSGKTATFTLKDNIGVVGYGVNQSSTTAPSFTSISQTTSTSKTYTASKAGTYYVWVKDVSGRVANTSFSIAASAFNYAATLTSTTYTATGTCPNGGTLSNNSSCYFSQNSTVCGSTPYDCSYNENYDCSYSENYDCSYSENYSCTKYTTKSSVVAFSSCGQFCSGTGNINCRTGASVSSNEGYCYYDAPYSATCTRTVSKTCTRTVSKTCTRTVSKTCYSANSCSKTDSTYFRYVCNLGDTLSGSTCTHQYYVCPNGGTLSGTTCTF